MRLNSVILDKSLFSIENLMSLVKYVTLQHCLALSMVCDAKIDELKLTMSTGLPTCSCQKSGQELNWGLHGGSYALVESICSFVDLCYYFICMLPAIIHCHPSIVSR